MKWLFSIILFHNIVFSAHSQNEKWTIFNNSAIITAIDQDSNNTTWIATYGNGFARITDSKFTLYKKSNQGSPSDIVISLKVDHQNNVWVVTDQAIMKFVNNEIAYIDYDDFTSDIAIDSNNNIWVGAKQGLKKYDGTKWTIFNSFSLGNSNNTMKSIKIDSKGIIWVGSNYPTSAVLIKFDGTTKTEFNYSNSCIPNVYLNNLFIDSSDNKWVSTANGLVKFNENNCQLINSGNSGIANNQVQQITVDNKNNKWISTNGGLCKFNDTNWVVYNKLNSGIVEDNIFSIYIDPENIKWIGTLDKGICLFKDSSWLDLKRYNRTLHDIVTKIAIDTNNILWLGSINEFIKFKNDTFSHFYTPTHTQVAPDIINAIVIDSKSSKWVGATYSGLSRFGKTFFNNNYTPSNSSIPSEKVTCIALDSIENKWIGTPKGLVKYDGTSWTNFTSAPGIGSLDVLSIDIDNKGAIWIASNPSSGFNLGLIKFDGINWTSYTQTDSIPNNILYVTKVKVDNKNNVWLVCNNGLLEFRDSKKWIKHYDSIPFSNLIFNDIQIDENNNKWFCTNKGLIKYDGLNWKIYNTENSLIPVNDILSFAIDGFGNKWIGTNGGGLAKLEICDGNGIDTSVNIMGSTLTVKTVAKNYQWINCTNGVKPIIGATKQSYAPKQSGNYAVIIYDGNCAAMSACFAITICNIDTSIIKNVDTLIANEIGASYQWIDCDSSKIIQGATNKKFVANKGNYAVIITKNNCVDTSVCFSISSHSSSYYASKNKLNSIYPNPVIDILNIDLNEHDLNSQILIYNSIGNLCYSNLNVYSQKILISTSSWANGIYNIVINNIPYKFIKIQN